MSADVSHFTAFANPIFHMKTMKNALVSFDYSLKGRKYCGRGWRSRAVIYLNKAWKDDKAKAVLATELHEMLHAVLHKLGIKFWANERAIVQLEYHIRAPLALVYRDNGYLRTWAEIELQTEEDWVNSIEVREDLLNRTPVQILEHAILTRFGL